MLRRTCTDRWKIRPMNHWIRDNDLKPTRKEPALEKWLGITADEAHRARTAPVQWNRHVYPFLDAFNPPMTRTDVINWLIARGLEVPPRSSCIICPYHSKHAWREMKHANNGDWADALAFDRAIRDLRPNYDTFLHEHRIPLEDVDLRTVQEKGQTELWPPPKEDS